MYRIRSSAAELESARAGLPLLDEKGVAVPYQVLLGADGVCRISGEPGTFYVDDITVEPQ